MQERDLITSLNEEERIEQQSVSEPVQRERWIREQRDNRDLGNPRRTRRGEWRPCPLCAAGMPDHH